MNTDRLHLRPTAETDFAHTFRLQSNPDVMRFIRPATDDQALVRERMTALMQYREDNPGLGGFVVELLENQQYIGNAILRHVEYKPGNDLEVGYALLPDCWGKGYATEITRALVAYAQENFGARRLVAFTAPENTASNHVLEKCGFRNVGLAQTADGEGFKWELILD